MREHLQVGEKNTKGCLQEADRLKTENGDKGEVYYVAEPPNLGRVYHAYYLPDITQKSNLALNHIDNGFGQYPQLTVGEVMELGFPIPKNISATQLINLIESNW